MKDFPLAIDNLVVRRSRSFKLAIPKLQLRNSRFYCLTGANGSGKTTLLETVSGLILPDSGSVRVFGADPFNQAVAAKAIMGFVPDDDGWIIAELTAREYFSLLTNIYQKSGVSHDLQAETYLLAKRLLFNSFDQQLGSLSHGNRKKVQLIAALAHRPGLLIIDELRNGLDPVAIKQAEILLTYCKQQGATVLAATHDLWWAERLADEILVIKDGQVVWQDQPKDVKNFEAKFMELYDYGNLATKSN